MLPNTERLPPLSFLPTPTVYSSRNPAGLLHPASSHGVRVVSCPASRFQSCNLPQSSWHSPNSPLIPSEAFPSSTAALRHRNRCHPRCSTGAFHARLPHRSASRSRFPLATRFRSPMLPPVCFSQSPHRQPRGFSPSISPLPRVRVATHPRPDAPLGFVPL